jgi:hypothetical protein
MLSRPFFAKLTRRRSKRGVFRSLVDIQAAIKCFLAETNNNPKPFVWTADPRCDIAAVRRGYQVLNSIPYSFEIACRNHNALRGTLSLDAICD